MSDPNPYAPPQSTTDDGAEAKSAYGLWKRSLIYAGIGFPIVVWLIAYLLVVGSGAGFWAKFLAMLPFTLVSMVAGIRNEARKKSATRREVWVMTGICIPVLLVMTTLIVRFFDRIFMSL